MLTLTLTLVAFYFSSSSHFDLEFQSWFKTRFEEFGQQIQLSRFIVKIVDKSQPPTLLKSLFCVLARLILIKPENK